MLIDNCSLSDIYDGLYLVNKHNVFFFTIFIGRYFWLHFGM